MPLPIGPILVGMAAHEVASRVFGYALHPVDNYISTQFEPDDYARKLKAWQGQRILYPSPETLIELLNRDMLPGYEVIAYNALNKHGIRTEYPTHGGRGEQAWSARLEQFGLWQAASDLKRSVPGIADALDWRRRFLITDEEAQAIVVRAGGNWKRFAQTLPYMRDRPGIGDVIQAIVRDRLSGADLQRALANTGADVPSFAAMFRAAETMPSVPELMQGVWRGLFGPSEYTQYLKWLGIQDAGAHKLFVELLKTLPSVSDLVAFTSRQLWAPELVGPYGLYDGFDERSRPWFAKLGLDYPLGFNITVDGNQREATLPDLFWAASREILPLQSAYLAYQRLREDQVGKYKAELPNLKPFTIDDLRLHMRVAGYPPPMQDFLIALSHPPIGFRQVQWGIQFGGKDRTWASARYMDLGYRPDDARDLADIAVARDQARQLAWVQSIERRAHTETISEIEGLYDEGLLGRDQAMQQLSAAGLLPALSAQLLDLSDSKRARALLREAVRSTGRDYLSGVLSAAEALSALAGLGINSQRAGELMQIWTIRRSRRRRQADTSRVLKWVGTGRLSTEEGRARLANLGWRDPDLLLLTADAQAQLDRLHAQQLKAAQRDEAAQARQLASIAREHKRAAQEVIAVANRQAPRGVLARWLKDGIITEAEYREQMADRGYTTDVIDDYVKDITAPKAPKPKASRTVRPFPAPSGSAHPTLAMAQKWYLTEIIDEAGFRVILRDLGYGESNIDRIVEAAPLHHGAKGTTEQPPAAPAP